MQYRTHSLRHWSGSGCFKPPLAFSQSWAADGWSSPRWDSDSPEVLLGQAAQIRTQGVRWDCTRSRYPKPPPVLPWMRCYFEVLAWAQLARVCLYELGIKPPSSPVDVPLVTAAFWCCTAQNLWSTACCHCLDMPLPLSACPSCQGFWESLWKVTIGMSSTVPAPEEFSPWWNRAFRAPFYYPDPFLCSIKGQEQGLIS